jgi:hypothetical protein
VVADGSPGQTDSQLSRRIGMAVIAVMLLAAAAV